MNNESTASVLPYIFGAAVVTYVSTFAPPKKDLTIEPLIGMFILGSVLLVIGLWLPELATGLAALVLVTSLVINGTRVVGAVNQVSK